MVEVEAVSDSESGNNVLRSAVDEKEVAAGVGLSVFGEEILEDLSGTGLGVEGVAVEDEEIPDGVGAAGDSESV